MNNSYLLKTISFLSLFLICFFYLINNINILSSLESTNLRLSNEISKQEETLNRTLREQEINLSETIREREAKGELEFINQSKLVNINQILPKSKSQDEASQGLR